MQENGLVGLTTKQIATEVGFTEAALYRHFSSKEAILKAMIDYVGQALKTELEAIDPFLEPKEKLMALVFCTIDFFQNHQSFIPVFCSNMLLFEPKYQTESVNLNEPFVECCWEAIKHGQDKGVFRIDLPTDMLTELLTGYINAELTKWLLNQYSFNISEKGTLLLDRFLLLIKINPHET